MGTRRNFKLTVEFDGTAYHGWQVQPDLPTVQGTMEEAASSIFQQPVEIHGAGRTDAGVHATGYVCNFLVDSDMPVERVPKAMAARLPDDIVVRHAVEVSESFHARFDALARRYRYQVSTVPVALRRHEVYVTRYRELDVALMREGAGHLVGQHDFTSFTPAQGDAEPVCDVRSIEVSSDENMVTIVIEGNRFLHNMVRIIVGTLIDVGRGHTDPERIPAILRTKDRTAAGPTVPPQGLAFIGALYPE